MDNICNIGLVESLHNKRNLKAIIHVASTDEIIARTIYSIITIAQINNRNSANHIVPALNTESRIINPPSFWSL